VGEVFDCLSCKSHVVDCIFVIVVIKGLWSGVFCNGMCQDTVP
jgi:hypothetical protein